LLRSRFWLANSSWRLFESRLGGDAPLQELFLALEVRLSVVELRLRLLHTGAGLVHLALQRSRVDFGEDVPELHLLADGEANGLQLPADLEREAADVGRLQHARKAPNTAFGCRSDLVGAQTADRLFVRFLLLLSTALQADDKEAQSGESREMSDHRAFLESCRIRPFGAAA
jgi:hypothetical protein